VNIIESHSTKAGKQVFLIEKEPSAGIQQTDRELWDAFKEGSLTAYKIIYQQNAENLLGYGNTLTSYRSVASDCIQDLFVDLWNKRSKLGEVNHIKGYLFTCYKRRLIDMLKKQQKFRHIKYLIGFEIFLSEPVSNWDLEEDQKAAITSALNELPYQVKEAIYLRFFNNLPCPEIGIIMGIKTQSVYNLISSGLKTLRVVLHKHLHF
jgi:RNA polymerase sigma factor (sigma-70 family)